MKMAVSTSQTEKRIATIGKQCSGKSLFVTEFINITACGTYIYHRHTNGEAKEATNNC
jgi:hypothetical protein